MLSLHQILPYRGVTEKCKLCNSVEVSCGSWDASLDFFPVERVRRKALGNGSFAHFSTGWTECLCYLVAVQGEVWCHYEESWNSIKVVYSVLFFSRREQTGNKNKPESAFLVIKDVIDSHFGCKYPFNEYLAVWGVLGVQSDNLLRLTSFLSSCFHSIVS